MNKLLDRLAYLLALPRLLWDEWREDREATIWEARQRANSALRRDRLHGEWEPDETDRED